MTEIAGAPMPIAAPPEHRQGGRGAVHTPGQASPTLLPPVASGRQNRRDPRLLGAFLRYSRNLPVSQGRRAGEMLELMDWQKNFAAGALADDCHVAALTMARGGGKSTFLGAIGAAAVGGPLAKPRGDVIIVASSFSQARTTWEHGYWFAKPQIEADKKRWRVVDNTHRAEIEDRETGARLRALPADPARLHSLAPSLVIVDEPAQQAPTKTDRIYAALETSLGKIPDSRLIAIGTRPADSSHWFERLLNGEADYSQAYFCEPGAELTEANFRQANPSYDHMPDLRAVYRAEAAKVGQDSSLRPQFDALRLNAGVIDFGRDMLLQPPELAALETDQLPEPDGGYVLGFDLGSGWSQSAACAAWQNGRTEVLAAWPRIPSLTERALADQQAPGYYEQWAIEGSLITLGERVVDVGDLVGECLRRWGEPETVVADRWRLKELADAMAQNGLNPAIIRPRGQGFKDGGADVSDFRAAAVDRRIRVPKLKALRGAMSGAVVVGDPAGNWKLHKGLKRSGRRDDIAAAMVLAVAESERQRRTGPTLWTYAPGVI